MHPLKFSGGTLKMAKNGTNHQSYPLIDPKDLRFFLTVLHTTFSGHFFTNCIFIFHKTEVGTVILRCLTGVNYNNSDWFKSYDTNNKYFYISFLCDFVQKLMFASFAFFAFLCFISYLLYQLTFKLVKALKMTVWISVLWKINM